MERELMVLVIEDDQKACEELRYYIEKAPKVHLQNVTNNSTEALEMVENGLPDVVILDLELHHGYGNGLMFLAGLQNRNLSHRPYILVTTNNSSNVTYEQARSLGADFIMSKHEQQYSAQYVVDFILMMRETILGYGKEAMEAPVISEEEKNHRKIVRIQRELDFVGISPKMVGYKYLTDAILLTIQDPGPNLCRRIGEKYHKTDVSVERAMQNAINRAWRLGDPDELLEHYAARIRSDKGVPTLMEFVHYYASRLKQELQ